MNIFLNFADEKMDILRKIKIFVIAFLIPAILAITYNAVVNKHYHVTASGVVIEHAHPFAKSNSATPFQKHKHTKAELVFLALLSNTVSFATIILAVIFGLFSLQRKQYLVFNVLKKKSFYVNRQKSRAPPSFF